jgi:hypothetical protein
MKRMLTVGMVLALVAAVLTPATAPARPSTDVLGIYTADNGTGLANRDAVFGTQITAYIVLSGCSTPEGISGWECSLVLPTGVIMGAPILTPGAINVGTSPDFAVGLPAALPRSSFMRLATLNFFILSGDPLYFKVRPISPNPTRPGCIVYAGGDDPGHIVIMNYSSGSETLPVFGINTGPLYHVDGGTIPTTGSSWGAVKSLYR